MPLGGSTISWAEGSPSGTESIGLGDNRIRSMKTDLRTALDSEHNWPTTGGAATGYHRLGSGRAFFGTQSRVSSTDTDGRMMIASDTSRLFGVGSTGTVLLGSPLGLSVGSYVGVTFPQRAHMVILFGREASNGAGAFPVTYPDSGFSTLPQVWLQSGRSVSGPAGAYVAHLQAESATAFTAKITDMSGASILSEVSLLWCAIGHRAL